MAVSQPTYTNVFVPAVTEQLIVDYSRNPKDFLVNMLAATIPVDKPIGLWPRFVPDSQARSGSLEARAWVDGQARPIQLDNMHELEFTKYFTQRYDYNQPLGYKLIENAFYDVEAKVARDLANKAMLARAVKFYSVLADSNNHLPNHIQTATSWGGGVWSTSTTSQRYIQKGLMAAVRQVIKDSVNSGIGLSDLFLVLSPAAADTVARAPEIADYIKESTAAAEYLEFKTWAEQNRLYGLPQTLYGIKVVVDETVKDAVKLGETSNKQFLPGDSTAYLIVKKGGVKGSAIGTAFGSVTFFIDKGDEMKTEVNDFPVDRRKLVSVSDSWDCQVTGKEVSCVITSI